MRAERFVTGKVGGSVRFDKSGLRVRRDEEAMSRGKKTTTRNLKSISGRR